MKKASLPVMCAIAALCIALMSGCSQDGQAQQQVPAQAQTQEITSNSQAAQSQETQPDADSALQPDSVLQTEEVSADWYLGSWECTKVKYENMELESSQVSSTPFAFELRADGTVVMIGTEQANPAAWETAGSGVVIIDGDWEMFMEKQGDVLVWNDDGIDMIITRMDG